MANLPLEECTPGHQLLIYHKRLREAVTNSDLRTCGNIFLQSGHKIFGGVRASLKYQFKVQIVFVNFALFKRGLEFGGPLHHRDSPPSPSLGVWELGTGLVNFNVME